MVSGLLLLLLSLPLLHINKQWRKFLSVNSQSTRLKEEPVQERVGVAGLLISMSLRKLPGSQLRPTCDWLSDGEKENVLWS